MPLPHDQQIGRTFAMRNEKMWLTGGVLAIILSAVMGALVPATATTTLNFLCWAGVDDAHLLGEFEKDTGIKVRFKTFVGADSMYSLLTNSSNQYDVVMVGQEYIGKLYADGRLATLDPANYDLSQYIPTFRKFPFGLCEWQNDSHANRIWGKWFSLQYQSDFSQRGIILYDSYV
jgi:spermidine/putrescine-binding protein